MSNDKKFLIKGEKKLSGEVFISGSKNAALPIMAASLLTKEKVVLKNIPTLLTDIKIMISLLEKLGKEIIVNKNTITIQQEKNKLNYIATYDIVQKMRASIVVLGPLLARIKKAVISYPGGCSFGLRPINLHLEGLKKLGTEIEFTHGDIQAKTKQLTGKKINLMGEFGSSVLATDNVLMAACLAKGRTEIVGAAKEPETQDLINFLNHIGAKIHYNESGNLIIDGVESLSGGQYTVIDDRIEAFSFVIFSAISGKEVKINFQNIDHIEDILKHCISIGIDIKILKNSLIVKGKNPNSYKTFKIVTQPYPGFPTDMQPLYLTLATLIPETCFIHEKIYPSRFNHVPELIRMGADITIENDLAIIQGVPKLDGTSVAASDLRSGAALIAAALAAEGETVINETYHIERGYESVIKKLQSLHADVKEIID